MGLESIVLPLWLNVPIAEMDIKVQTPVTVVNIAERTRDQGCSAGSATNVLCDLE